jgi:hypothetical protein
MRTLKLKFIMSNPHLLVFFGYEIQRLYTVKLTQKVGYTNLKCKSKKECILKGSQNMILTNF